MMSWVFLAMFASVTVAAALERETHDPSSF